MKSLFGKILNTPIVTEPVGRAAEDEQIEIIAGEIDARVRIVGGVDKRDSGVCGRAGLSA